MEHVVQLVNWGGGEWLDDPIAQWLNGTCSAARELGGNGSISQWLNGSMERVCVATWRGGCRIVRLSEIPLAVNNIP